MSMIKILPQAQPATLSRSYLMGWGASITFPAATMGLILVSGKALYGWAHPAGTLTVYTISGKAQPTLTERDGNITISFGWNADFTVWCSPK